MVTVLKEPQVYLVSSPQIRCGLSRFLKEHGGEALPLSDYAGQTLPEVAGRLCYMSYKNPRPGGNSAYLQHILEVKHLSVVEHSNYGFIFTGISRNCTHELIRHRVGMSYSELSQRYVDCSEVAFVMPHAIQQLPPESQEEWIAGCEEARKSYEKMVNLLLPSAPEELSATEKRKHARQAARSVLPGCTETRIFVTGNVRAWRHFISLRASRHAEVEIRRLACKVHAYLFLEAPDLFEDFKSVRLNDGTYELVSEYNHV